MGINLRFADDGVIGEWSAWLEDKAEEFERLDVLYEKWAADYAVLEDYPYGATEFLGWLKRRGVKVTGPHWSGELKTQCTQNFVNWLDQVVHYTVFELGEVYFVAVAGVNVKDPGFYRLICDEPDDFLGFTSAWMECEGGHAFETEDTEHWRFSVESVHQWGPEFALHELGQDQACDRLCPKCDNKILKVGAY
ncbi:hypothetical protein [Streptomyces sp. NRRL F-5053]|uniref:hypothetical protein n=1 Tax=Streptomyces sp. NRRL F-5053 TaxID=1463854 RepID=UPI0004CB8C7A|nr:hypothetical protein [Streptomyces sp. NRRL F-5053]